MCLSRFISSVVSSNSKLLWLILFALPLLAGCSRPNAPQTFRSIQVVPASATDAEGLTAMSVFKSNEAVFVSMTPILTEVDIERIDTFTDDQNNMGFSLTFKPSGANLLAKYTSANPGAKIGFVVDGVLVSAPTIRSTISDKAVLYGNFKQEDIDFLHEKMMKDD